MYPNQFALRHIPESLSCLAVTSRVTVQQPHQPSTCRARNCYDVPDQQNKDKEQARHLKILKNTNSYLIGAVYANSANKQR